jgi:hypothetical protein
MMLAPRKCLVLLLGWGVIGVLLASPVRATELKPQTVAAFDEYVGATEARMGNDLRENRFLVVDSLPDPTRQEIYADLRQGQVYIHPLRTLKDGQRIHVPDGMIHHWVGVIFIPGATISNVMDVLGDYEHQRDIYKPDVRKSTLLDQNGNESHFFEQFYNKSIISVVLNANFHAYYTPLTPGRAEIRSYSTRIAEVQDPGKSDERELPVGNDHGYLWRIYSYWRIEQKDGGVYVQVESLGLSRTIPAIFELLVRPLLRSIPEAYLTRLLDNTRKAVMETSSHNVADPGLQRASRTAEPGGPLRGSYTGSDTNSSPHQYETYSIRIRALLGQSPRRTPPMLSRRIV